MEDTKVLNEDSDNESSDSDVIIPVAKRVRFRKYSDHHGIKASFLNNVNDNPRILNLFFITFDNKFWEILVTETNRFADQTIHDELKKRYVDDTWYPVTLDEIKAYYALCILMDQVKKSNIQLYWTKRAVLETPIFRQTMPFMRFLHFSDNETDDSKDRLRKIRPVINFCNQKFKEIYTPNEYVSIDESLMKYKGRLAYKQFNPSKRARFGIKIYKLCEATTGFCHGCKIYTDDSASENVVIELSKSNKQRIYFILG
ncbi:piggyBac transposable element-derived protein 4-like [Bombus vosnesenskii]|uniref:PiggyBac transposable element-derived protein 4-like n=1 Tax=Bombus vosnesenskii TaxID=207650 RepID=A0A6J3L7W3_9HYME|nr:piggyBac transposable element-derived protein 4-like [Bombus vosnesenskii]